MSWPPSKLSIFSLKTFLGLHLALELQLNARTFSQVTEMSLCPFHPSFRARCSLCQIQEPSSEFSFHLREIRRKLFPWYRNVEHSLKNSEIPQLTPL